MNRKSDRIKQGLPPKPKGKTVPGRGFKKGNPYRFKPGVSGNPGGRPKGLSKDYRAWLETVDDATGLTYSQLTAESMGNAAIKGDVSAAREIRQATEGDKLNVRDSNQLTAETRAARIAAILDAGRARRAGSTPDGAD